MGVLTGAAQGLFGQIGGAAQGIGKSFTAQNGYQDNTGGQDYASLLQGTQAQTATNQANQNSLGQQLLAQSQGQGANPAQMQLQQALNQNQQNQAGATASQKGINPGLAQKQIMTNGANQAQQAAGQGALLGAQQQLAAQGQLGTLYNQMGNQNLANQGQYENSLNGMNTVNAGVSQNNANAVNSTTSGLLNAGGSALAAAHGGEIPDMHHMMAMLGHAPGTQPNHPVMMAMKAAKGGTVPGQPEVDHNSYQNDKVHAMLTPEEIVLPLSVTKAKDPGMAAKMFVDQIKSKTKKGDDSGYAKVLAAKRKVS